MFMKISKQKWKHIKSVVLTTQSKWNKNDCCDWKTLKPKDEIWPLEKLNQQKAKTDEPRVEKWMNSLISTYQPND